MSQRLLIKTCVLLAVTVHIRAQYIDFFQGLNSFLQPFTTLKPAYDATKRPTTKHRQAVKQKYQDIIFFEGDPKDKENDKIIDPFNFYTSTVKPRRKSKTSTTSQSYIYTTHSSNPSDTNKIIRRIDYEVTGNNNYDSYNSNVDNREVNNARRVDSDSGNNSNNNVYDQYTNSEASSSKALNYIYGYQGNDYNTNRQTTQRTTTDYYNNQRKTTRRITPDYYNNHRQTTRRTTTDYYNNQRQTTRRTTTDYYNNQRQTTNFYNDETTRRSHRPYSSQTTSNPLLNRPGVIPAVVNDNKPPITNRPLTERPVYDKPFDSGTYRPARPSYEIDRTTKRPFETRPANTRPPYEIERPTSGIHRPISSGVRPITSGSRPSGGKPNESGSTASNEDSEPEIEIGPDEDDMSDSEKRRLYDICEQKCEEYKAGRVKKVVALPLAPNSQGVEVNVSSCAPTNIPLIIGGEVVQIEQFPHMALIGWKKIQNGGYSWKCGGSLVSERFVLTAGHCTYHDKDYNVVSGPPHVVQLGSSTYNDASATRVQISLVVRHPKYKLRRSYHDVALIKLQTTVTFSDKISPACLGVPPPVGAPVIATGWGKTEFGGDSSTELRSVSIPIWDMSDCRNVWGTSLKLPDGPMADNQVCAGEPNGAKDTCQGDSGGPAQVQDGCTWRVVALTSVGRSCGAPGTPALYATIPRAFIASQVYTNAKSGRDGNDQYGNVGAINNGNNNRRNGNNDSGIGNGASSYNNQFDNQGVGNRPLNNNGGNFDNILTVPNNNGQSYSGIYNREIINNQQPTRNNNDWTSPTRTSNNRNNNGYVQNTGYNQNHPTTIGYDQNNGHNNNGQVGYNEQNGRDIEYTSDIRNYSTQNSRYNDNGNNNVHTSYLIANRPWWNR